MEQKQEESIKLNLSKFFYDFKDQRAVFLDKLDKAKKRKNAIRFSNSSPEEEEQAKQEKKLIEQDKEEIETKFSKELSQFIEEFSRSKTKWIIQIYFDKMDTFMKEEVKRIVQNLNLQLKEDRTFLSIARQGKSIQELQEITKLEAQKKDNKGANNQQPAGHQAKNNDTTKKISNQQQPQQPPTSETQSNQSSNIQIGEIESGVKANESNLPKQSKNQTQEVPQPKNENNIKLPVFTGSDKSNSSTNIQPVKSDNSSNNQKPEVQKEKNELKKPLNPIQPQQTIIEKPAKQEETPIKPPSQPKAAEATNKKPKETEATNKKPKEAETNNKKPKAQKVEETVPKQNPQLKVGETNQEKSNKQATNKSNNDQKPRQQGSATKQGPAAKQEEVDMEQVLLESMKKKSEAQQIKELIEEAENEQKNMSEDEVIKMLRQPAESINKYHIVDMKENYQLNIKVEVPEKNSFPIIGFQVFLVKENKSHDLFSIMAFGDQQLDTLLIEESNNLKGEITIDLIKASKIPQFNSYLKPVGRKRSILFFAVVALTQKQSDGSCQEEILMSKIESLFRLNLPLLIEEKTSLMMAGSLNLISKDFFNSEDAFEGNLSSSKDSLKRFIQLDDPNIFSKIQPQAINTGKSSLVLLKNGQVIQWGEIVAFKEEKPEYKFNEDDDLMINVLTLSPIMPVVSQVFVKIAQGEFHYAGISIDGQVFTWGINSFGQLGHSNYTCYPDPKRVEFFTEQGIFIVDVKCGENFTVCLSSEGELFTFGKQQAPDGVEIKNGFNEAINYENNGINQPAPRKVNCQEKVYDFFCAEEHCLFITERNTLYLWGDNTYYQILQTTELKKTHNFVHPVQAVPMNGKDYTVKLIACSSIHNVAVLKHKVTQKEICICWGNGKYLDAKNNDRVFTGIDCFEEIFIREGSLFAIDSQGVLVAHGFKTSHQLGVDLHLQDSKVLLTLNKTVIAAEITSFNSSLIITKPSQKFHK